MGLKLDSESREYVIHDRRVLPGEDAVRQTAIDIADEVMSGLQNLNSSHTLMIASLFITDEGAKLALVTRSFDTEPAEKKLEKLLKRVTKDPVTGNLNTYVIPILEREKAVNTPNGQDTVSEAGC
ncbi:MAG: hypothetical protein ACFE7R_01960 [Candidatus Hodarchaeota archaeon]